MPLPRPLPPPPNPPTGTTTNMLRSIALGSTVLFATAAAAADFFTTSTTATISSPSSFVGRALPLARVDAHLSPNEVHERRRRNRARRARMLAAVPPHERRLAGYKEHAEIMREPDGVYYTTVRIGTSDPNDGGGKPFTLITDTGSSTIAVPCKGCSCGPHNHFEPSLSPSHVNTGSRYSQCYGEGSCNSGSRMKDKMCFGKKCPISEAVMMSFGCCTKYAPSFKEQEADGIIGLGHSNTLVQALQNDGELQAHVFSLCLGENKGRLTVGGCEYTPICYCFAWRGLLLYLPTRARLCAPFPHPAHSHTHSGARADDTD